MKEEEKLRSGRESERRQLGIGTGYYYIRWKPCWLFITHTAPNRNQARTSSRGQWGANRNGDSPAGSQFASSARRGAGCRFFFWIEVNQWTTLLHVGYLLRREFQLTAHTCMLLVQLPSESGAGEKRTLAGRFARRSNQEPHISEQVTKPTNQTRRFKTSQSTYVVVPAAVSNHLNQAIHRPCNWYLPNNSAVNKFSGAKILGGNGFRRIFQNLVGTLAKIRLKSDGGSLCTVKNSTWSNLTIIWSELTNIRLAQIQLKITKKLRNHTN
jgi:hypothetical protein